jgi:hypothetical protein
MSETGEMILALRPVIAELERLNIRYYVGGSVASSHHGAGRSTQDVDLNVELDLKLAPLFLKPLKTDFYVSEVAVQDAIRRKSCFNLLRFGNSYKIDLFVSQDRPFDRSALERATVGLLGEFQELPARIATPEDIILLKLDWYRLGDFASERQWLDVSKVAKLYGVKLDKSYLEHWATNLQLTELWNKLKTQVNL